MNLERLAQIHTKRLLLENTRVFENLHALSGVAAPIIFFAGYLFVSAFQGEYEPLSDTLSRMARMGRSYSEVMNLTIVVSGILIGFFARGLDQVSLPTKPKARAPIFLAAFGFGLAGTGLLPCDSLCGGDSLPNYLHTLPAFICVMGLLFGLKSLPASLPGRDWADIRHSAQVLAWGGLATLITYLLGLWRIIRPIEPYIGVIEKSYVIVVFVFIFILALRFVEVSRKD